MILMRQCCILHILAYWKNYIILFFGLLFDITVYAQLEDASG